MTIVVTVNVEGRYRGFLASAMLEIAPGVYTARDDDKRHTRPNLGCAEPVALRSGQGSIVMTWRDPSAVGEQRIRTLGEAPKSIVDADGVYLVKYS